MSLPEVVVSNPKVMHGTPVFKGTRVPVQALLDHLEAGDSLEVFLHDFPTVERGQAIAFIELAGREALAPENVPAARSPAQPHLRTTRLSDTRTRS